MKLSTQMKKKNENSSGTNLSPSLPIVSRAMPSRTKR